MNIAVIGCGNIAATHAQVLNEMGLRIALCVDNDIEISKAFAEKWHAGEYSGEVSRALESAIDVAHVCTPPALHYGMVKALINARKHVFCEKPLCLDNTEADELAALAVKEKVVNAVGYNIRYHLPCREIAKRVQSPAFGRIYLIHGSYLQEFNAFPAHLDWRYDKALAGSMRAVTEIGSHWFDLAQTLSGKKITAISAAFGNFNPTRRVENGMMIGGGEPRAQIRVDSEDAAVIHMKFEDNAVGSVILSEVSQGRINRLHLEITGEHENVWWDSENNNVYHIGKKNAGIQTSVFPFGNGFADTQRLLFRQVYGDIEAGAPSRNPSYPTFKHAAEIVRLCNAAYQSANGGSKWIQTSR